MYKYKNIYMTYSSMRLLQLPAPYTLTRIPLTHSFQFLNQLMTVFSFLPSRAHYRVLLTIHNGHCGL